MHIKKNNVHRSVESTTKKTLLLWAWGVTTAAATPETPRHYQTTPLRPRHVKDGVV